MSANFRTSIPAKKYNEPMSEREIERALDDERNWHRLQYKHGRGVATCTCGMSFIDPSRGDIRWRHDVHVRECVQRLQDRLDGVSHG